MTGKNTDHFLGGGIQDLYGSVGAPPSENSTVLGMERHAVHTTGGIWLVMERHPRSGIPDLNDTPCTTRGQELPIRAERHAVHVTAVSQKRTDFPARRHVPDPEAAIRTGRSEA